MFAVTTTQRKQGFDNYIEYHNEIPRGTYVCLRALKATAWRYLFTNSLLLHRVCASFFVLMSWSFGLNFFVRLPFCNTLFSSPSSLSFRSFRVNYIPRQTGDPRPSFPRIRLIRLGLPCSTHTRSRTRHVARTAFIFAPLQATCADSAVVLLNSYW